MGPLVKSILVMVLLDSAFLLTPEHQNLPTTEPIPSPSLNIKFDPWRRNLTWDCRENTTSIQCVMISNENGEVIKKLKEKECHCTFQDAILHEGIEFMVTVNISQRQITEKVFYSNPGGKDTGAQNVSCFIYNVDFMNCTWAKGPAAPDDVQYFLYIQDLKRRERHCPRYIKDAGTHVGCHLEGASELFSHIYIVVNGTSQKADIQFFDELLMLKKIEIYNPPRNITVHCNRSHCLIQWEKPRTRLRLPNSEFQYQLDIHRQNSMEHGGNQLVEVFGTSGNKYNFLSPQPRARHTVQIRAADYRILLWGAWSHPAEFGSGEWGPSNVPIYVLVILGTLFCVLALSFVFKRFVGTPIPRIKDKLSNNHTTDDEIIWEKFTVATTKGDYEEILAVREVGESTASV